MSMIDYVQARKLLDDAIIAAEAFLLQNVKLPMQQDIRNCCKIVFSSNTQAYREVLLGCTVARILDKSINIRQPYIDQGPNAFSGRTLDEKVVNPFLHDKRIPSTRGPYLSVFRRSVQFDLSIREGLRDKLGYDAFLKVIGYLEVISDDLELENFLQYLLYNFVEIREAAHIQLYKPQRLSFEQFDTLISGLLATPSGGRLPVFLVVAAFRKVKTFFGLHDWSIAWQEINAADTASG
ncbi:MAG: hypothetical protein DRG58_10420, partial [Deltaproteobacteria bacterium]